MNRNDARMLAEELYRLMHKDVKMYISSAVQAETEEWLNTDQAAEFLGVSVSYIKKNILDIPHSKIGRLNKFRKSSLIEYLNR